MSHRNPSVNLKKYKNQRLKNGLSRNENGEGACSANLPVYTPRELRK